LAFLNILEEKKTCFVCVLSLRAPKFWDYDLFVTANYYLLFTLISF